MLRPIHTLTLVHLSITSADTPWQFITSRKRSDAHRSLSNRTALSVTCAKKVSNVRLLGYCLAQQVCGIFMANHFVCCAKVGGHTFGQALKEMCRNVARRPPASGYMITSLSACGTVCVSGLDSGQPRSNPTALSVAPFPHEDKSRWASSGQC